MNSHASPIPTNLLLEHGSFVRGLAYSLLRDEHLAEDAAQETWLRWMQNPPEERGRTRGWLATVVRGAALSRASSRRARRDRELAVASTETGADPTQELEQAELIQAMVAGVIELEEPLQSAILLTYFRGWTTRRIARELGVSPSTVSQRVRRGLGELRSKLDRDHGGDRERWCSAMGAVAGNGALASKVPAGLASLVPLLPWLVAAVALVLLVPNWLASPGIGGAPAGPVGPGAEGAALAQGPAPREPAPAEPQVGERQEVALVTPEGKVRFAGRVINRAYPALALPEGPADGIELHLQLGKAQTFGSPEIREVLELDGDGHFDLTLDDPGVRPLRLALFVRATETYHGVHLNRVLEGDHNEWLDLTLSRVATGHLSGRIVDPAGLPLPGVEVLLKGRHQRANVERTIRSDEKGHFQVEQSFETRAVALKSPGYSLVEFTGGKFERNADGESLPGWSELQVVLAPAASLRVHVLDPGGAGIAGARVRAVLHPSELLDGKAERNPFEPPPSVSGETDGQGVVDLTGVWAGKRFEVQVRVQGESYRTTRGKEGTLVFEPTEPGDEILLATGERRELTAHWGIQYTLRGTVTDSTGQGVPDARVRVFDGGEAQASPEAFVTPRTILTVQTSAEGEYVGRLLRRRLIGPLVVVAEVGGPKGTAEETSGLAALGYASSAPSAGTGPHQARSRTLPLDSAVDGVLHADLQLEPSLSLAGTIRSADGTSLSEGFGGSRLWAVPAGSGSHLRWDPLGAKVVSSRDGKAFRFSGLPPGKYDIHVSREMKGFYSFTTFLHRFEGLAAGREDLDLVVPEAGEVHIKVRVHGTEAEQMTVLHGRYFPDDPARYKRPVAPELQAVRSLSGWTLGAPLRFTGISGERTEDAQAALGLYGTKELKNHDLPPMGAGWYSVGVNLRTAEGGTTYFPMATPVQRFEPGNYVIDFHPVETVSVRGTVLGSGPLALWMVDDEGHTLPWSSNRGMGKLEAYCEANAAGGFEWASIPVGEWRVRLGTPAEIAQGRYQKEQRVSFFPGMGELRLEL